MYTISVAARLDSYICMFSLLSYVIFTIINGSVSLFKKLMIERATRALCSSAMYAKMSLYGRFHQNWSEEVIIDFTRNFPFG